MKLKMSLRLAILLLGWQVQVRAFYLPGVAPKNYATGEAVEIKVNKLDSTHTQLPYNYYDLPVCQPDEVKIAAENLGEVLRGDKIENTKYDVTMRGDIDCATLCIKRYPDEDLAKFRKKIVDEYRVYLIADNLPAVKKWEYELADQPGNVDYFYEEGFLMGQMGVSAFQKEEAGKEAEAEEQNDIYLNNHLDIVMLYHQPQNTNDDDPDHPGYRVVGFEVRERSIAYEIPDKEEDFKPQCGTDPQKEGNPLSIGHDTVEGDKTLPVAWTYRVKWERSEVKWASRWDPYLKMMQPQIHWFSILNSFMIVLFLTGMVALILLRALHKDFRRYNQNSPEDQEAQAEETGWKLVHGDVFRAPECGGMFATLVGTGVQIFWIALVLLITAGLGFLSPANRGALMTTLLLLFVFMGVVSGYWSARIYKNFQLTEWKSNTIRTAFLYPGICFVIFFTLNLVLWSQGSSGAVPFGTLFALLVLWFGISVPLVFLGAYFGFKKDAEKFPVKTNQIPRKIPEQPWYMQAYFSMLVGGVLPFGACFIEIFFIMSSVWLHRFYYMFGFLFLVFLILVITSAEITIVMCYFQLCAEDYRWWWRSFLTSGSSALYLFLYSILYFYTKLHIRPMAATLLYFGYMFLVSLGFFVLTGTIGYFACYYFVHKIYSSIKVD